MLDSVTCNTKVCAVYSDEVFCFVCRFNLPIVEGSFSV